MCGIAGIVALTEKGKSFLEKIQQATDCLSNRGPDAKGYFLHGNVALGHRRLSIIDITEGGAQPMTDRTNRYVIIFNGEFFNYKEHKKQLEQKGFVFRSESDTEVLLQLFINEGEKCLEKVNGFFALAVYDKETGELFFARDRFGVKPFLIYSDENIIAFASEMKALLALGIKKEMDEASLYQYLQLNYIPQPFSIFKNVSKLSAGCFIKTKTDDESLKKNSTLNEQRFYRIPYTETTPSGYVNDYESKKKELFHLMDAAVERRLVSDVPLGTFLSGGIDSSVVTALAARHVSNLNTFSIGFRDEPLFDETHYAKLVAEKCKTNHTVFSLTTDDLYANLHKTLDYLDEPFADSSALNVHILSMHTRKHVTVALSGDGADEVFGGYNKHRAEFRLRAGGAEVMLAKAGKPLWKILPKSRNSKMGNKVRQLLRFSEGASLSPADRYWRWAGISDEQEAKQLMNNFNQQLFEDHLKRKSFFTQHIAGKDLNEIFLADVNLVLPGDMLTKVDLMSMANSLEVRTPFLDYTVVDFAFSLPSSFKIDSNIQKKIVQDTFREILPAELYNRPKQGFEVPLLKWFRTELKSAITDDLLKDDFVKQQGIFNVTAVKNLKQQLFSSDPGDSAARTWALIVFQYWWKKNLAS